MRRRIALFTSSYPPKTGGIASAHFNLCSRLRQRHDVHVFTYRDPDCRPQEGVTHGHAWPVTKSATRLLLRKLLRQKLLAGHFTHCDAIADTAANIRTTNASLRRYDPDLIICPDHYLPALLLKKPPRARLIWMARNNYLRFTEQPLVPPPNVNDLLLAYRLERRAVRKADAVLSPSAWMLEVFRRTLERNVPMDVTRNFVDEQQLSDVEPSNLREQLELPPAAPLVYFPSAGIPMKGLRYLYELVRAAGGAGPAGVYVSGTVPSDVRRELLSLAPRIRCHLPGHVPYAENLRHVAACDLTISPTLIENLSNALVESIMLGVPVLTFDTGGNREIVIAGQTGVVVGPADIEGLVRETRLAVSSREQLDAMKSRCRQAARTVINAGAIDEVYEAMFDRLLGESPSTETQIRSAARPLGSPLKAKV
jgi:glycosyltransferase involved in cell wall biosynthesis